MAEFRYRVDGQKLLIMRSGSEQALSFAWPIAQVLEFPDILVVRTEPAPKACDNENVYGVSPEGRVVWRVGPRKYVYGDSPFTGLIRVGEKVKLFNWDGLELILDPRSGAVIGEAYGK